MLALVTIISAVKLVEAPLLHEYIPLLHAKYNGEATSPGIACINWNTGSKGAGHGIPDWLVAIVFVKVGCFNWSPFESIILPAAGFIKSPTNHACKSS